MTYTLYAGPGSPYSHKLRAVLRYRRIPHRWLVPQGSFSGAGSLGADRSDDSPLARANKGVVPVLEYPDGSYGADSTPLIYDLEQRHPGREVVPPDPAVAFLAHLIEDMADEYLPFPMFYFRWTVDGDWCARRQMIGWSGAVDDVTLDAVATQFRDRQHAQLGPLAQLPSAQVCDAYDGILAALEAQFSRDFFLFGDRPSLAEFGLYGQLTQYAIDPFVSTRMRERAVRVFSWVQFMDDLSGIEPGDWRSLDAVLTPEFEHLAASLAPGYFGMLDMLRARMAAGTLSPRDPAALNGPGYRLRAVRALKAELAALPAASAQRIRPLLEAAGCWTPLQFLPGEADEVVPIRPG